MDKKRRLGVRGLLLWMKSNNIIHNAWLGEDGLEREFCNQACRWEYEFNLFSKLV